MPDGARERVKKRGTPNLFQGDAATRGDLRREEGLLPSRVPSRVGEHLREGRPLGQVGEPVSPQVMHGLGSSTDKKFRIAGDSR